MNTPEPVIVKCSIGKYPRPIPEGMFDEMPEVKVTLSNGEENTLFEFYPDELSFTETEFIGLTVEMAHNLRFEKDVKFLQS